MTVFRYLGMFIEKMKNASNGVYLGCRLLPSSIRYVLLATPIRLAFRAIGDADTPSALAYVLDRYAVCAHTARESILCQFWMLHGKNTFLTLNFLF